MGLAQGDLVQEQDEHQPEGDQRGRHQECGPDGVGEGQQGNDCGG